MQSKQNIIIVLLVIIILILITPALLLAAVANSSFRNMRYNSFTPSPTYTTSEPVNLKPPTKDSQLQSMAEAIGKNMLPDCLSYATYDVIHNSCRFEVFREDIVPDFIESVQNGDQEAQDTWFALTKEAIPMQLKLQELASQLDPELSDLSLCVFNYKNSTEFFLKIVNGIVVYDVTSGVGTDVEDGIIVTTEENHQDIVIESELNREAFEVQMDSSYEQKDGKVFFIINTNLPDDTEMMLTLSNEEYNAQTVAKVENGSIYTEGFSNRGEQLHGNYVLSLEMSLPKQQSSSVIAKIGTNGEKMTGPLVVESVFGDSNIVKADFPFEF